MRIDDFIDKKTHKKKRKNYMKIAREMAKEDKNIKTWLDIWDKGIVHKIPKKKTKKGESKYEIYEIKKHSPYIKKQIEKAVRLRLEGKVYGYSKTE